MNSAQYERSNTSHPFRCSHLKTLKNINTGWCEPAVVPPHMAEDADLRAAIDRAVEDARAAGEGSLRMRLEILRQEVQAAEDSLVETLGSVGRAVVAVSVQA